MKTHIRSSSLFAQAQRHIPGGVNSPARAFKAVGRDPLFIERADGARLYDEDGNSYLDYIGSWGPMILGHRHPAIIEALEDALRRGTSFGAPTSGEIDIADLICEIVPSIESVRLVNSGTEATMSAIRVARGYTGRDLVVKFIGNYHGHVDSLLVKAGSGLATLGISDSAGVPASFAATTIALPYNSLEAVAECFRAHGDQIACVILEPVVGNMGCIPPAEGYLEGLRRITEQNGALLIFDEVMTGFRVALGGAQERYGVTPDMTTLGKIIGGGLPVGAYGGRKDIMDKVSPVGPVYQAGTLSGNPLAVAAGLATLKLLKSEPQVYGNIDRKAKALAKGVAGAAASAGVTVTVNRVASMLTFFFNPGPVTDWDSAAVSRTDLFAVFFRAMLDRGVYLPCSQFEAAFVSASLTDEDIDATIRAAEASFKEVASMS
jgi:glutamate-1-semialdehyde 2,1-aminomutase